MPRFTDARIKWLCEQVTMADTEEDLEVALEELRQALQEHVRLAKQSLSAQAGAVNVLDVKAAAIADSLNTGSPKKSPENATAVSSPGRSH